MIWKEFKKIVVKKTPSGSLPFASLTHALCLEVGFLELKRVRMIWNTIGAKTVIKSLVALGETQEKRRKIFSSNFDEEHTPEVNYDEEELQIPPSSVHDGQETSSSSAMFLVLDMSSIKASIEVMGQTIISTFERPLEQFEQYIEQQVGRVETMVLELHTEIRNMNTNRGKGELHLDPQGLTTT